MKGAKDVFIGESIPLSEMNFRGSSPKFQWLEIFPKVPVGYARRLLIGATTVQSAITRYKKLGKIREGEFKMSSAGIKDKTKECWLIHYDLNKID